MRTRGSCERPPGGGSRVAGASGPGAFWVGRGVRPGAEDSVVAPGASPGSSPAYVGAAASAPATHNVTSQVMVAGLSNLDVRRSREAGTAPPEPRRARRVARERARA